MNVIVKKTIELSQKDINSINQLFQIVFNKERTSSVFKEKFFNTAKNYSYHALVYDDQSDVVAHNAYIPFFYKKDDVRFEMVLSVDAMIHPLWRGRGIYHKLLNACDDIACSEGCKFRIGFPNNNSYPIQKKYFKMKEIGSLDTYCLPIKFSGISSKLRILNIFSIIGSFFIICLSNLSRFCTRINTYKYSKERESFNLYRYKWFDGDYQIVKKNNVTFIYRKSDFKGKQAIFLMDVYPLSKANFDNACRYIYFKEFGKIPFIIYVGSLSFTPFSLIKIPNKFEPKHFHFIGKSYDDEFVNNDAFDIKKWEVNLSNYDLL